MLNNKIFESEKKSRMAKPSETSLDFFASLELKYQNIKLGKR